MNISIHDRNGPDQYKAALCMRARIAMNGRVVQRIVEADEEQGYILQLMNINDPRFKVESQALNDWPLLCFFGRVRIIDPDTVDLSEIYLK